MKSLKTKKQKPCSECAECGVGKRLLCKQLLPKLGFFRFWDSPRLSNSAPAFRVLPWANPNDGNRGLSTNRELSRGKKWLWRDGKTSEVSCCCMSHEESCSCPRE